MNIAAGERSADWAGAGVASRFCTFMGVEIELGADVLVPRQETELLARTAIDLLALRGRGQIVIDMCCGSGNLALALASRFDHARVFAADLTASTIETARRNAARLGLADRLTVHQGDLFQAGDIAGLAGEVDLVVCNPPYIPTRRLEADRAHLLAEEPREAFDGGPYGISIHQRLVRDSVAFLRPGGWLAFEFGEGQDRMALSLINRSGGYDEATLVLDEHDVPRVALARRRP